MFFNNILKTIDGIGELAIFFTPLTFTIGIINSIKKSDKEAKLYKILAIISAYLIFTPMIFN